MSVQLLERLMALGKEFGYAGVELGEWVSKQVEIEEKKAAEEYEREEKKAAVEYEREERRLKREEQQLKREEQQRQIAAKAQEDIQAREEERRKTERLDKLAELEREERLKREVEERNEKLEHIKLEQQRLEMERDERLKIAEVELQKEIRLAELRVAEKKLERNGSGSEADSDGEASHTSSTSRSSRKAKAGPKLPHFDESKDNIDSYLRRFERYASLQDWPEADWAIYLSALLKGKALEVYSRLPEEEARSYGRLKAALLRKYELTVEGFRKRFYAARREKEETASQFVCRLEGYLDRWIQLAEIDQSFGGLRELIVREQFLSISEEKLTLYLRERNPKELSEMVQLADMYLDARLQHNVTKEKKFKDSGYRKQVKDVGNGTNSQTDVRTQDRTAVSKREERRICYQCKQPGHISRYCPKNRNTSKDPGRPEMTASFQEVELDGSCGSDHGLNTPGELQLRCGCKLPFVGCFSSSSSSGSSDPRLPIVSGKVNGHSVSVLRDTGCTTVVIRRELVADEQRTGEYKYYRMLDGSIGRAEVALVDVESPVFTGKVEGLCIESPTCDLVIGNVPGAKSVESPEVVAVTTRAQAKVTWFL